MQFSLYKFTIINWNRSQVVNTNHITLIKARELYTNEKNRYNQLQQSERPPKDSRYSSFFSKKKYFINISHGCCLFHMPENLLFELQENSRRCCGCFWFSMESQVNSSFQLEFFCRSLTCPEQELASIDVGNESIMLQAKDVVKFGNNWKYKRTQTGLMQIPVMEIYQGMLFTCRFEPWHISRFLYFIKRRKRLQILLELPKLVLLQEHTVKCCTFFKSPFLMRCGFGKILGCWVVTSATLCKEPKALIYIPMYSEVQNEHCVQEIFYDSSREMNWKKCHIYLLTCPL